MDKTYSVVDYQGNVYGHDMTLYGAECLINNFSKKEIVEKEIEII